MANRAAIATFHKMADLHKDVIMLIGYFVRTRHKYSWGLCISGVVLFKWWCRDWSFYIWGCCNRWVVILPILWYSKFCVYYPDSPSYYITNVHIHQFYFSKEWWLFVEPENRSDFTQCKFSLYSSVYFSGTCTYIHKCTNTDMHTCTWTHICTTILVCIQDGFFPLSDASQEGYDEIVQMLLQAGATVDLQNKVKDWFNFVHLSLVVCYVQYSKHSWQKKVKRYVQHTGSAWGYVWSNKIIGSLKACLMESAWGMFFPKFGLGILLSVKKKKNSSDFLIMNPELSYMHSAITSYF